MKPTNMNRSDMQAQGQIQMRLRLVATVDFRKGVPTHIDELRAIERWPDLKEHDVVLLISGTGQQLAFVFKNTTFDAGPRRGFVHGISSYRVQLDKRSPWNPLMLKNYAEQAGISLVGIRRFEEFVGREGRDREGEA